MKSASRMLAVLSVAALVLAASVNADARERVGTVERTVAPAGVAVNEILGMEVRTHTGEEIATVDDVIFSHNGQVMEVVLDYEGDLVAIPIGDLRFTSRDHVIYAGTRSDLDAARDHYVYGEGPYVYPQGYAYYAVPRDMDEGGPRYMYDPLGRPRHFEDDPVVPQRDDHYRSEAYVRGDSPDYYYERDSARSFEGPRYMYGPRGYRPYFESDPRLEGSDISRSDMYQRDYQGPRYKYDQLGRPNYDVAD